MCRFLIYRSNGTITNAVNINLHAADQKSILVYNKSGATLSYWLDIFVRWTAVYPPKKKIYLYIYLYIFIYQHVRSHTQSNSSSGGGIKSCSWKRNPYHWAKSLSAILKWKYSSTFLRVFFGSIIVVVVSLFIFFRWFFFFVINRKQNASNFSAAWFSAHHQKKKKS